MTESEDIQLLQEFAERQSESAFGELTRRHLNLVYSVALRQTGNAHDAEEITQAVFIILARKAGSLGRKTILSGWLYQTARLTAANFLRTGRRRAAREQEAYMQSLSNESDPEAWRQIAPLLDDAMARLGDKDRDAVVLRYFQGKSLQEVGAALGASEDAAKMRVNRALEKLRKIFSKRGVVLTVATLGAALATNSAVAAPAGLATTFSASAVKGAALSGSTFALVNETLKIMAWVKYKMAIGLGAAVVVAGGTATTLLLLNNAPSAKPVAAVSQNGVATPVTRVLQPLPPREPFTPTVHMTLSVPPGAVALQPDGKLLIGSTLSGWFVDENAGVIGAYRRGVMRLLPDGTLDRTFLCQFNDTGACDPHRANLVLQADGRMLVSGLFDAVDGQTRPGFTMLLPDGRVDENFVPTSGTTNGFSRTYMPGGVFPAAMSSDGSVAVLGQQATHRLDASGRLITATKENPATLEFPHPSSLIMTLGSLGFSARKPVDWTRELPGTKRKFYFPTNYVRSPVADLPFDEWNEPPTALQGTIVLKALFDASPLELCRYAVHLPDGGFILAVEIEARHGLISAGSLMRFDKDWRPDLTFTNRYDADIRSCVTLKLQKDGKLLVAGIVGKFNGEKFPGLVRLEKDGSLDRTFHCETAGDIVGDAVSTALQQRIMGLAPQDDGRIVIGGYFTKVNGVEVPHLARLNPDGSLNETFRTPFTSWEGLKKWRRVPVLSLAKAKTASEVNASTRASAPESSVPQRTVLITSLQMNNGVAVIQFTGEPRQVYILQAADSLDATAWTNISTNKANAAGTGIFRDESARDQPMRFYRIAVP